MRLLARRRHGAGGRRGDGNIAHPRRAAYRVAVSFDAAAAGFHSYRHPALPRLAKFAIIDNLAFAQEKSPMPTRNISLTPEQDAFIEDVVRAGEYQNASEAVRDALRVLQQRRREDVLRLKTLRMQIKAGVEALDRGDFTEVDDAELDSFLERLSSPAEKRAR
jgi:antitoxin ParD1/3/4